jgi:hypothetical protein
MTGVYTLHKGYDGDADVLIIHDAAFELDITDIRRLPPRAREELEHFFEAIGSGLARPRQSRGDNQKKYDVDCLSDRIRRFIYLLLHLSCENLCN